MFVVFAAFILASPAAARSSNIAPPQATLSVQLIHRCPPSVTCVRARTIDQMVRETQKIWSWLDVRIAWIGSPQKDLSDADASLTVFLEEQGAPPPPHESVVLASLRQPFVPCGAGLAHLFVRNIRGFAAPVVVSGKAFDNLPDGLVDLILGRALGRALAHEIGHYLLGTGRHTPHGLMRAELKSYELLEAAGSALYGLNANDRGSLLTCRMDQTTQHTHNGQPQQYPR